MRSIRQKKKKIVITAAITGAITTKEKNKNLPLSPDEIVSTAVKCHKEGASIIHIHVRDENHRPSLDYSRYSDVIKRIRKATNVLICMSTSSYGVTISDSERLKLYDLNPDFASLTFGDFIRVGGANYNSREFINKSLDKMLDMGIIPEIEIFNEHMLNNCIEYFNIRGIVPYVQLIFGAEGGMPGDIETVEYITSLVPQSWMYSLAGVGKNQLPINLYGMLKGCDGIRTGFEDNVYCKYGELADSNEQLVARLRDYADSLNIPIADVNETRYLFSKSYKPF